MAAFCLMTATYAIEQYCGRRLCLKRHFEWIEAAGDPLLPLREYPVRELLAVYGVKAFNGTGKLLEPELYQVFPEPADETGEDFEDTVSCIALSPGLKTPSPAFSRGYELYRVVYRAGYGCGEAPADLASACFELAAWNLARYRGRRIGLTGNDRGSGKDGEHMEASMPENVRMLLEPYRRKTI
jgi:hypothetical protein